jgi:hypothetical protein
VCVGLGFWVGVWWGSQRSVLARCPGRACVAGSQGSAEARAPDFRFLGRSDLMISSGAHRTCVATLAVRKQVGAGGRSVTSGPGLQRSER